jgi:septal ring factor EnvC (AmiA/AmiB activator)
MTFKSFIGAAASLLLIAAPASAQEAKPGGACIVREQGEQLIATLKQRNDQLREMSARMREMEAQLAAAQTEAKDLENNRKALVIAAQKNRELADIGEAIIVDYEKMDLGKRLASKEPLTQLYRVRLQNKLQEFRDQIAAQGFYPERELNALQAPPAAASPPSNP